MSKDRLAALALLLLAALYLAAAFRLKIGAPRAPGPGFLPVVIGVGLLVCAAVHLLQTLRVPRPVRRPKEDTRSSQTRTVVGLLACTFIYPLCLNHLNFVTTTFLAVFTMLRILRYKSWAASALVGLLLAVACFLVFGLLLGVAVPSGPIEELLYRLRG